MDKAFRIHIRRIKKARKSSSSKSQNSRLSTKTMREKFGIKVPNSIKEALLLDVTNGGNKLYKAIQKELMALKRSNTWKFRPTHDCIPKEHQKVPLRMIFDTNEEDLRRKAILGNTPSTRVG